MKMTFLFVLLSFITGEIKLVFPELLLNPSINTGSRQRIGVRCITGIALQKKCFLFVNKKLVSVQIVIHTGKVTRQIKKNIIRN